MLIEYRAIVKNLRIYWQNPNRLSLNQREACRQLLPLLQGGYLQKKTEPPLNRLADKELAALLDRVVHDPIAPPLLAAIKAEEKPAAPCRQPRWSKRGAGMWNNPAISIHAKGDAYSVEGDVIQAGGSVFKGDRQRHTHTHLNEASPANTAPHSDHMAWTFLNLNLSRVVSVPGSSQNLDIRHESTSGNSQYLSTLPLSENQPAALYRLLEQNHDEAAIYRFSSAESSALEALFLMKEGRLAPREYQLKRVGRLLFNCLFPDETQRTVLNVLIRQAAAQEKPLILRLEFHPNDTLPASLPWELIHDGKCHLLLKQKVTLTRAIAMAQPPGTFECTPPYKVALMSLRPRKTPSGAETPATRLGAETEDTLLSGLLPQSFQILNVTKGTLNALKNILDDHERIHIFHGDGHSAFYWRCDRCGLIWPRDIPTRCQACDAVTTQAQPTAALSITAANGTEQFLDSKGLGILLAHKGIRLVCLSACQSAKVAPSAMFVGFAQNLIHQGIPIVLGMQLTVGQTQAARFFEAFYKTLARGLDLRLAAAHARTMIFDGDTWYRPVLYLHAANQHKRLIHFPCPPNTHNRRPFQ